METNIFARPKSSLKKLVTRSLVPSILGVVLFVQPAWSGIGISPSPSTNGAYSVSWGSPLGCNYYYDDFGALWEVCYSLTESGPTSGLWTSGSSPRNFSGKPSGTYTYTVHAHFVSYMWGVDYWQSVEGPTSVNVCTTYTVPRYTGWVDGLYHNTTSTCTFYSDGPVQYPSEYDSVQMNWCDAVSPLPQNGTMQICS